MKQESITTKTQKVILILQSCFGKIPKFIHKIRINDNIILLLPFHLEVSLGDDGDVNLVSYWADVFILLPSEHI